MPEHTAALWALTCAIEVLAAGAAMTAIVLGLIVRPVKDCNIQ